MTRKKHYLSGLLLAAAVLQLAQGQLVAANDKTEATSSVVTRTENLGGTGGSRAEAIESATSTSLATKAVDARVKDWLIKQQFQVVQTLFRTDVEGKKISGNIGGYQTPEDLPGYTYLSTIVTTTSQGPALVHLYQDASFVDSSIVRTEYIDGMTGQKVQSDKTGQVFEGNIGERRYYNGLVVTEKGEKVYKIFYLTDDDYISYMGTSQVLQLASYTRFVDKTTGEEIALRQHGLVQVYEVDGYRYIGAELVEENGSVSFVQSFEKEEQAPQKEVAKKAPVKEVKKEDKQASEDGARYYDPGSKIVNDLVNKLPITNEMRTKIRIAGVIVLGVLGLIGIVKHFREKE